MTESKITRMEEGQLKTGRTHSNSNYYYYNNNNKCIVIPPNPLKVKCHRALSIELHELSYREVIRRDLRRG